MSPPSAPPHSRRALLTRFGALVAGGSLVAVLRTEAVGAKPDGTAEANIIAALLSVQQAVALAYRVALRSHHLRSRSTAQIRPLERHVRAHVTTLTGQLRLLDPASSAPAPPDLATAQKLFAAHQVPGSLSALRSERDALALLLAAENVLIGAYFKAISQLSTPALLRLSAEMMASEAQHALVLGELLHPRDISRAAPDPFVQGVS